MAPFVMKFNIKRDTKRIKRRIERRRKLTLNKHTLVPESNRFDIVGNLPLELTQNICARLNPSDLRNALRTCRKWKDLVNDDYFWKHKCKLDNYLEVKETSRSKIYENFVCNSANYWERVYVYNEALHENWRNYKFKESIPDFPKGNCVVHYFDDEILIMTNDTMRMRIYVYNYSADKFLNVFPIGIRTSQTEYIIKKTLNFVVYSHRTNYLFIVWCIKTGLCKLNMFLSVEMDRIRDIVIDKNLVAILLFGGGCQIVNILSEKVEYKTNLEDFVSCVCFHEDQVAFGSRNGIINIMNWEDKAITATLIYDEKIIINRIMINCDYLISFSAIDICVWSLQKKTKLHVIVCGDPSYFHVYANFSNSTTLLAINAKKSILEAWDVIDGTCKFNVVLKDKTIRPPVIMNDHYIFTNTKECNGASRIKVWCKKTGEFLSSRKFDCKLTKPLATNTKFIYLDLSIHPSMHIQDFEKKTTLRQLNSLYA